VGSRSAPGGCSGRGFAGLVIEDHDAARQLLSTTQIVIDGTGRTRSFPLVHRYAWPSELDLMARLSGMTLENRWSDWHGHPFDARSTDHVSVWRLAPMLNGKRGSEAGQGEVGELLRSVKREENGKRPER
jgi:hypothetical protein